MEKFKLLLSKYKLSSIKRGEYLSRQNQVILYIASFKENNLAEIIRVLSHEVFHLYHKEMVSERYFRGVLTDNDLIYKRTILMETLADYFSLYYLEENKKYLESYGITKDEIEK